MGSSIFRSVRYILIRLFSFPESKIAKIKSGILKFQGMDFTPP